MGARLRQSRMRVRYQASLLGVAALWGGAFVAIRSLDASGRISAATITLLRFALTSLVMVPIVIARPPRVARRDWWRVGLMAVLGGLVYHLSLNEGERFVSAGVSSLIVAAAPVLVAILAVRFLGERMTPLRAAGIALAMAGVAILIVWGSGGSLEVRNLIGALLVMVSPLAWAVSTIVGKPAAQRYDPIALTALTMVLGTVVIVPFTVSAAIHDVPGLAAGDWFQLAYLAFACTALAYLVWYSALRHLDATSVAGTIYLVPPFALVWAAIFLGERLTVAGAAGGAMVLAGVVVAERLAPRLDRRRTTRLVASIRSGIPGDAGHWDDDDDDDDTDEERSA